eukprot:CAMPEP_0182848252 /NCGR_PEP_ID=MMETSP0006_2-20121128/28902_1 /TAXON_ID=97485 /ORGANISM="Prymnesium parvum, Strain Texoma1" /LENGTH=254 /DNA_ID=CAMNT_0024978659 /DNA_START=87 /DNA_END=851 /DNA_ORIENTATION=+
MLPLPLLSFALSLPLLQKAPSTSPMAHPGTSALSSPAGFEQAYDALREMRGSSGRTLLHISQLEEVSPGLAAKLSERVNFNVPRTARDALACFFSHATSRFIAGMLGLTVVARCFLGPPTAVDAIVAIATAIGWCFQEHLIHEKLLHSSEPWFGSDIHRWHHALPYYHVSLDGVGLAACWFAAVGAMAIAGVYEAAHYIAHTRVPLPRGLNNVRAHHMKHHLVDNAYWFAFTLPAIDRILGTDGNARDASSKGS